MTDARGKENPIDPVEDAAQDWFLCLTSGAATAADLEDFRAWRDADPCHGAAFERVRSLWNDIDDLKPVFAPDVGRDWKQRGTEQPRGSGRAKSRSGSRRNWPLAGGLIAACLALLAAYLAEVPTLLRADHRTGVGEQTAIALPDGSRAFLNTDSAIALAYSVFQRRVVLLRGEVLFEVAEDPAHPFSVQALDGQTTALGTTFVVKRSAGTATVTVAEGRVRLVAPAAPGQTSGTRATPGTVLGAGQQATYPQGGAPGSVKDIDATQVAAWRAGSILIDDRPFAQALAEIDRYRPGRILLVADTSRLDPVTARISIASIDKGLEALAATQGLEVLRVTDYLVILR